MIYHNSLQPVGKLEIPGSGRYYTAGIPGENKHAYTCATMHALFLEYSSNHPRSRHENLFS